MDPAHKQHRECWAAIRYWAGRDQLAVNSVTYAELAAGAQTCDVVNDDLRGFTRLELDFDSAWRAGQAFRHYRPAREDVAVLPDFFIRAQAAVLSMPHLTSDHRSLTLWPDVDFLFPPEVK